MIDFHSHILPGIDDGSGSVRESIALLEMLKHQGIDTVCATPHFLPKICTPEQFLEKRSAAYEALKKALPSDSSLPKIRLGAEINYFSGISRMSSLFDLRLEGTNLILLEMPFDTWSDRTVKELIEFSYTGEGRIVLAHIERYLDLQKKSVWETLYGAGILMQVNAPYFINKKTKRKALKRLKKGGIHLIGSDCHNVEKRPPQMSEAFDIIESKLGYEAIKYLDKVADNLLN